MQTSLAIGADGWDWIAVGKIGVGSASHQTVSKTSPPSPHPTTAAGSPIRLIDIRLPGRAPIRPTDQEIPICMGMTASGQTQPPVIPTKVGTSPSNRPKSDVQNDQTPPSDMYKTVKPHPIPPLDALALVSYIIAQKTYRGPDDPCSRTDGRCAADRAFEC